LFHLCLCRSSCIDLYPVPLVLCLCTSTEKYSYSSDSAISKSP
uniref:Ovule protein n=1 Tax=Haemonchus placei TaxID=6290 RepID=A0A0N4WNE0_HAEPC